MTNGAEWSVVKYYWVTPGGLDMDSRWAETFTHSPIRVIAAGDLGANHLVLNFIMTSSPPNLLTPD